MIVAIPTKAMFYAVRQEIQLKIKIKQQMVILLHVF